MGHRHKSKGRKRGSGGRGGRGGRGRGGNCSNGFTRNIDNFHQVLKVNDAFPPGDADLSLLDHGDLYIPKKYRKRNEIEDFYFNKDKFKPNSMSYAGLRRERFQSDDDMSHGNNKGRFTERKVAFIRAKDNYDPSHEMILKLAEKNKTRTDSTAEHTDESSEEMITDDDSNEMVIDAESEASVEKINSDDSNIMVEVFSESENEYDNNNDDDSNIAVNISDTDSITGQHSVGQKNDNLKPVYLQQQEEIIMNDNIFFVDEEGDTDLNLSTVKTVHVTETVKTNNSSTQLEFNPTMTIGKVEVDLEQTDSNIVVNNNTKSHPFSGYIANVMKRLNNSGTSDSSDEDEEDDEDKAIDEDEFDIEYTLSNDYQQVESLKDEEKQFTNLSTNQVTTDIESLTIAGYKPTDNISESDDEPEFGFCEEDFMINTEEIEITNIRLGYNDNSYFTKCLKLFGDHEFKWVDQELLDDFIINELGLPENRLKSYYKYIHNILIPKEEESEPTFSDIPFSDTDEEDESDDSKNFIEADNIKLGNDMLEGLDDLVSYSLRYDDSRNQEYEPSRVQIIGKGKKKKLLVSESLQLDHEIISTLQSKLESRSFNKARKYKDKNDFISQEDIKSEDLSKKYPFGFHVLNIKDEFDLFLQRLNRDSLSFPPLDPHGNKTITKFAKLYNVKTKKSGKGKKQHIVIQKVKKTNSHLPNYNLINQLTKQRPVFMRVDVSRIDDSSWTGKLTTERGITKAKFHVKEGELVGENAPEIDKDNIGRRILEKLGWSIGEGLGAHGNKGISEPVLAVVKTSKKGLGHSVQTNESDSKKTRSRR